MNINHKASRWLVVMGAILIQLALGALYAWSVFTKLLTDPEGVYQFTATQTAWIFSAGLATFALVMVLAGRWQAITGPRVMSMLGGLLLGLGFVLGGLLGNTFWMQFLFIGVVAGAGIGLAYVVPIAVGVKWFPDKKGMITGLAVAGCGPSSADLPGLPVERTGPEIRIRVRSAPSLFIGFEGEVGLFAVEGWRLLFRGKLPFPTEVSAREDRLEIAGTTIEGNVRITPLDSPYWTDRLTGSGTFLN